jgi:hypothetical protein
METAAGPEDRRCGVENVEEMAESGRRRGRGLLDGVSLLLRRRAEQAVGRRGSSMRDQFVVLAATSTSVRLLCSPPVAARSKDSCRRRGG